MISSCLIVAYRKEEARQLALDLRNYRAGGDAVAQRIQSLVCGLYCLNYYHSTTTPLTLVGVGAGLVVGVIVIKLKLRRENVGNQGRGWAKGWRDARNGVVDYEAGVGERRRHKEANC